MPYIIVSTDTNWSDITPDINNIIVIIDGATLTVDQAGECTAIDVFDGFLKFEGLDTSFSEPALKLKDSPDAGLFVCKGGISFVDCAQIYIRVESRKDLKTFQLPSNRWLFIKYGYPDDVFEIEDREHLDLRGVFPSISYVDDNGFYVPIPFEYGFSSPGFELGVDFYTNTIDGGSRYRQVFDRVGSRKIVLKGVLRKDHFGDEAPFFSGKRVLSQLERVVGLLQREYPVFLTYDSGFIGCHIHSLSYHLLDDIYHFEIELQEVKYRYEK